jgi:hypothetical protein
MAESNSIMETARKMLADLAQTDNPMRPVFEAMLLAMQMQMEKTVHGEQEAIVMPPIITASTKPLLASDVKAVKDYVDSNIASAANLYRSQVFHTAAAARYEHLKSDPAFAGENGDATKTLPQGFPKFAALKPVKLTISEHLPSDLLATQETTIATAARAYEKEALTQ